MKIVRLAPCAGAACEWTPDVARRLGLRYVLEHQPDTLAGFAYGDVQARKCEHVDLDALLVNLYEHLFTYPVVRGRLEVIQQMRCPSRILDYGCGTGYYSIALALAGHEVACWDTNPMALACITYTAGLLGLQAEQSSLAGSYDASLCINMLDHTTEPEECLDTIEAALTPGAPLYLHADFHNDGIHVSGKEAINRAFRAIATRFAHGCEISDWLQVWYRRHSRSVECGGMLLNVTRLKDLELRPVISTAVDLEHGHDGSAVVRGKVFYIRPCKLSGPAAQILRACDGMKTMRELAWLMRSQSMSAKDVQSVVAQLWERRIISIEGQST